MSRSGNRSERGAILIMVAISLFALILFSAIVLDYGIMWTGRAQAQNAADSAALAGALALTFDNTTAAEVKARARAVGVSNWVMGEEPDIQLDDVQLVNCPPTGTLPTTDTCVKVDAYRTVARNNPMPTFFANLAGISQQNARATATARAVSGTSAACVRPWAVGDKWIEVPGPWTQSSLFEPANGDTYEPPMPSNQYHGTGFSAVQADGVTPDYYGYQMVLKLSNPGQGANQIPIQSAGWAMELCLDNDAASGTPCGTPAYNANITGCTTEIVNISPWDAPTCTTVDPSIGCIGVKTGSTGANNHNDILDFIDTHDPDAYWTDGGQGAADWQTGVITSTESPSSRIQPVAIFSVPEYVAQDANGSGGIVRILKLVGFFIEGTCAENNYYKEPYLQCPGGGQNQAAIVGRLVNYTATGPIGPAAGGFGQIITLVR